MRHKQHPLSAAYPSMPEGELLELAEDIKKHGLHEPVMLFEDMVLDGWHRCQACQIAGVEIRYTQYEGDDPQAFVISKNAHRRHLSQSQKAAAATRVYEWRPRGGDQSAAAALRSEADIAKEVGVSRRTLQHAKAAEKAGLGDAVRDGQMSAEKAARQARESERNANGQPAPPPRQTPLEKAQARIAQLEEELAEEREKKDALADEVQAQIDASGDPSEQEVKFQQLYERIRVLESQVREWTNKFNLALRENKGLRKRLGMKP